MRVIEWKSKLFAITQRAQYDAAKRLVVAIGCLLFAASQSYAASADPLLSTSQDKISNDLALPYSKTPEYVILQPIDEATFSSETSASVARINVKEGSYFKKDETLLELDCRVQKAEYKKALAQQTATKIALKSAERLISYDSISEYELVKIRSDAEMADAEVSKLKAIVDKCILKAPFNGAVAEIMVHAFESVKPGDPLLKIVNTDHIIVELEVPSEWLKWLKVGYMFEVYINEVGKSIPTKVVRINPAIEPVSQTVKIIGEIADTKDKLMPGMSGQATFPDSPGSGTKSVFSKGGV